MQYNGKKRSLLSILYFRMPKSLLIRQEDLFSPSFCLLNKDKILRMKEHT